MSEQPIVEELRALRHELTRQTIFMMWALGVKEQDWPVLWLQLNEAARFVAATLPPPSPEQLAANPVLAAVFRGVSPDSGPQFAQQSDLVQPVAAPSPEHPCLAPQLQALLKIAGQAGAALKAVV